MSAIKMKVTFEESLSFIEDIPHKSCLRAIENNWKPGGSAGVTAQSICWLFCWAKTGMSSKNAAREARHAFNEIFDRSYEWFDKKVPHEVARQLRGTSSNVESHLNSYLSKP